MDGMSRDEVEIRKLVETWHRATSDGAVEAVLPLMTEDAVFLSPGRPPIRGRVAFAQSMIRVLKDHAVVSSGEIQEVRVSGDLAYCWTNLTVSLSPLEGDLGSTHRGPALSIFRRQPNGSWALARDANMLAPDTAVLDLKIDNLERELMADGPGG
jgi:uncharacterized protein (TIGR02246 family)